MAKKKIDLLSIDKRLNKDTQAESYFGKGISLAAGFDLGAKTALDSRSVVKTIEERDAHADNNRAYEGMLVYVEADKTTYQYTGSDWKEFGFNSNDFEAGIVNDLTTGGVDKALSAEMGKTLNEKIESQKEELEELITETVEEAKQEVNDRIDEIEEKVDAIETTWDAVTDKPFESLGESFDVQDDTLNIKVDEDTVVVKDDGSLAVKEDTFAPLLHNHDSAYASKAHEENEEIHLTAEEKENVGKIPTIESEVELLKTTVGAAATHIIVETLAELESLKDTCNHATIAHVIETNETYILEKNEDINGNQVTPEWIKLSDADALVSVDWSAIKNKPFSTVSDGLTVDQEALKVDVDDETIEISDQGQLKIKDGVFSEEGHTHVVKFEDVINKPVAFKKDFEEDQLVEGENDDEGLFSLEVKHDKSSENLQVKVIGENKLERFVAIEYVDENNIKIWTDEKEKLTVIVNSFDYTTTPAVPGPIPPTGIDVALVGKAVAGKAVVGKQ